MQVKKIIVGVVAVAMVTAFANSAIAAQPGAYVGGQLGYGDTHDQVFNQSGQGLAGRLFAGYQFNRNFATELGVAKFHTIDAKNSSYYRNVNANLKTYVVDLTGKVIIPVAQDLNLYGKLGGAYVIQEFTVKHVGNATQKKLLPTASVGVSYDISPNVAADVSYTRIQKVGTNSPNNIDFVGAGLTYTFS